MGRGGYTIPGYFENCVIKGNEVKENKLFGKTLFKYSKHELKEAKAFGSTVLVFKNGGIYKPGLFGSRLFKVTEKGEVKEDVFLGKVVGVIPPEWVDGFEVGITAKPNIKATRNVGNNTEVTREESLSEFKQKLDIKTGWCADYTNVKVGAETITCPQKYNTITAIAPALARSGLKKVKIHAGVTSINTNNVHGYYFIVDPENQNYSSENGVLYNKSKTIIYSVPRDMDFADYKMPNSIKVIGNYAFSFTSLESIDIIEGITEIGDFAFGYNKKLKRIYIPKSVTKVSANAFAESKRVVLYTPYCEKPSSWEVDIVVFQTVHWNEQQ